MEKKLVIETFDIPSLALNMPLPIDPPVGGWTWPYSTATLISGDNDIVLIDTAPTLKDSARLVDRIKSTRKELRTIYITHGHLDHYIGASFMLDHFPDASLVATKSTVDFILEEVETGNDRARWTPAFVEEIGQTIIVPDLTNGSIDIEDHAITAVEVGQSDISRSSYVHVPSLNTIITGDIAYNEVHPTLIDSDQKKRTAWIKTLNDLLALNPEVVVASHRTPDSVNDINAIKQTIAYLEDANRLIEEGITTAQFIAKMVAAYPSHKNLSTLIFGAASLGLDSGSA
ncbi:MAG: MBL fold metallo-hydrolase [Pseudomonadota bacterium]